MGAEERAALIAEARAETEEVLKWLAGNPRDNFQDRRLASQGYRLAERLLATLEAAGEEIAALEERLEQAEAALRELLAELKSSEARLADTKTVQEEAKGALRGMLELDSYRPRDGSVNREWEAGILADARAALAALSAEGS